jgi:hypothetical protein
MALVVPAMVIARRALTASQGVIAALVIAAFAIATMIIARLALAPSHAAVVTATVITPMTAFALALTAHVGGPSARTHRPRP